MIPLDTTRAAHDAQVAAYRRMTPEQRLALALSMSDELETLVTDGVRARHPDYDAETAAAAVRRLRLGDELYRAAYPEGPFAAP